jgi:hypothetical protein
MNRSLESRVGRLEQSIDDPDRIFVMWCGPDEDEDQAMRAAVDQGLVVLSEKGMWPFGRAVSCRWNGREPAPEPRWVTLGEMTDGELTNMLDSVRARLLRQGGTTVEEWDEMEREARGRLGRR